MSVRRDEEAGFALLVMFGVMAVASTALLLAVQRFQPPMARQRADADRSMATVLRTARESCRASGAFPANLTAVAAAGNGLVTGPYRVDPFGAGGDLVYRVTRSTLTVRSRGPDRVSGNSDDITITAPIEPLARGRTRARLRLLRAVFLASTYRSTPAMLLGTDRATLLAAARDLARAKRSYLTADTATRAALTTAMASAAASIAAITSSYGLGALPTAVTGSGGLMQRLGLPDGKAVDGLGRAFRIDAGLGIVAIGADGRRGTNDDM